MHNLKKFLFLFFRNLEFNPRQNQEQTAESQGQCHNDKMSINIHKKFKLLLLFEKKNWNKWDNTLVKLILTKSQYYQVNQKNDQIYTTFK